MPTINYPFTSKQVIDMQCKCGAETIYHEHTVKTLTKAQEWDSAITKVPVIICRDVCQGCGRQERRKHKYPDNS